MGEHFFPVLTLPGANLRCSPDLGHNVAGGPAPVFGVPSSPALT